VLFTDEVCFGTGGIINIHNQYQWADHGVMHSRHQQQSSINVWTGTVGECLVSPHVLPHWLTVNHFRYFLTWSAKTTGTCTTGSQIKNVIHAWWCSGTL
jgi:hypothetical protein